MATSCSARGFRDVRYNELYEGLNDYEEQFSIFGEKTIKSVESFGTKDFNVYDHVAPLSGSSTASDFLGVKLFDSHDFTASVDCTRTPTPQNAPFYRPPSGRARSISSSSVSTFDRPMTAVRAAGYTSRGSKFDPFNQAARALSAGKKDEINPEYQIREAERSVNQTLEESAAASLIGQYATALEKAKEAGRRERALCKHREHAGLAEQMNTELTFAVCFNLGYQYQMNRLQTEALNTYSQIVKNKQFPQGGRLRTNMGNIYFEQQKFSLAIKMYRMALDQTPPSYKDTRYRIMRNIGIALMRIGQYQDAIQSFEAVMEIKMDHHAAYNLMVCYYVLGNTSEMQNCFTKMLLVKHYDPESDDDIVADRANMLRNDELKQELQARQNRANQYVLTSARLIAPVIGEKLVEGFDWVIDLLRDQQYVALAHEMEMDKALQHLHIRDFQQAITLLKEFEKKEKDLQARAATNLSFLYFLEGDLSNAEKHAELAVKTNRYNACALVNQGNCLFVRGDIEGAKALYIEAVEVDIDCIEAIYNVGLCDKKLERFEEALAEFKKISNVLPNNTEVLFQIGQVSQSMGNLREGIKWLELLVTKVMHDAGLLALLGNLYVKCEDEAKALHYLSESHRVHPTNIDITSWLGGFYLKNELYEKAMPFFQLASKIQPKEVKWQLMSALCYRRTGAFSKAFARYKEILNSYPENAECLRSLVHMCTSMGRKQEAQEYEKRLRKVERDTSAASVSLDFSSTFGLDSAKSASKAKDEEWELSDDLLPI